MIEVTATFRRLPNPDIMLRVYEITDSTGAVIGEVVGRHGGYWKATGSGPIEGTTSSSFCRTRDEAARALTYKRRIDLEAAAEAERVGRT